MALRWNSQTNKFEDVGGLVGNYQGTNVTQGEFDAIRQSGVNGGLDSTVVADKGGLAEQGFGDKFVSWFTPQGDRGTSVGGNVLGGIGAGVGAASGLASMYFAKKNFDLQKDQQNYLKGREAQNDTRKSAFAANAGNGAQY